MLSIKKTEIIHILISCTPVVHIKIAGKWMFIPLKMVLICIDPSTYRYGKSQFYSWVNQRTKWPCSIAMFVYQRVFLVFLQTHLHPHTSVESSTTLFGLESMFLIHGWMSHVYRLVHHGLIHRHPHRPFTESLLSQLYVQSSSLQTLSWKGRMMRLSWWQCASQFFS